MATRIIKFVTAATENTSNVWQSHGQLEQFLQTIKTHKKKIQNTKRSNGTTSKSTHKNTEKTELIREKSVMSLVSVLM